jgi:hypothetical protein
LISRLKFDLFLSKDSFCSAYQAQQSLSGHSAHFLSLPFYAATPNKTHYPFMMFIKEIILCIFNFFSFEGRCRGYKRSLLHFHAPNLNSRAAMNSNSIIISEHSIKFLCQNSEQIRKYTLAHKSFHICCKKFAAQKKTSRSLIFPTDLSVLDILKNGKTFGARKSPNQWESQEFTTSQGLDSYTCRAW